MRAIAAQAQVRRMAEETNDYLSEMVKWEKEMKKRDQGIKGRGKRTRTGKDTNLPPVRSGGGMVPVRAAVARGPAPGPPAAPAAPAAPATTGDAHTYDKGYKKWEAFDVNAALEDVDRPAAVSDQDEPAVAVEVPVTPTPTSPNPVAARPRVRQTPATVVQAQASREVTGERQARVPKPLPAPVSLADREAAERARGNDFFKAGDFQRAIKCYTACLGISSKSVAAFSNRAMCWIKVKEWRKAELDCTLALQVDPHHVKSLQRRAAARNGLGMHRAALTDLEAALDALDGGTGTKALAADKRKTRELLKAAMRAAPKRRVPVGVSVGPALPSAAPKAEPMAQAATPPPAPTPVRAAGGVVKVSMSSGGSDEGRSGTDAVPAAVASSAFAKHAHGDLVGAAAAATIERPVGVEVETDETDPAPTLPRDPAPVRAAGGVVKVSLSPSAASRDTAESAPTGDSNSDAKSAFARHQQGDLDGAAAAAVNECPPEATADEPPPAVPAAVSPKVATTTPTKTKKKITPKSAFELERLWRSHGRDAGKQRQFAQSVLRPDGKSAACLFGPKTVGTMDADLLCDLLEARLAAAVERRRASDAVTAVEALVRTTQAPRFAASSMFFSKAHHARLGQALDVLAPFLAGEPAAKAQLPVLRGALV